MIMKLVVLACAAVSAATAFTLSAPPLRRTPARTSASSALYASAKDAAGNKVDAKKVLVLGGDGFCGWPTSLYLSDQGHDVVIVDNLSRRNIDIELGCDSLTPISSPDVRIS